MGQALDPVFKPQVTIKKNPKEILPTKGNKH
jgi:hypothetical protein